MKFFKKRQNKRGFTLVELVVVIAVLAILAGVGAVAYNGYIEYAKKGVDRKTVGEIMNAIELADYANPGLFEEGESATVYLTSGADGMKPLKSRNGNDFKSALEDAFGDLKSVKLTYDGWKGLEGSEYESLFSNEAIKELLDEGSDSMIAKYLYTTEGTASFANDMSKYWADVEERIDALKETKIEDYLAKMVSYSNDKKTEVYEAWNKQEAMVATGNSAALYTDLARAYAFCSYVQRKYGDQYDEQLEAIKKGGSIFNMNSFPEELTSIRTEYFTSKQSEIDATAYLALMEAATTLKQGATYPNDEEMKKLLDPVVSSVAGILDRSITADQIPTALSGADGKVVLISVRKENGKIKFGDLGDLNPREGDTGDGKPQEPEDICTATHQNYNLSSLSFTDNTIAGKTDHSTIVEVNMCLSTHDGGNTVTFTYDPDTHGDCKSPNVVSGSVSATNNVESHIVTITATAVGSARVVINFAKGNRESYTVTVNITIKK